MIKRKFPQILPLCLLPLVALGCSSGDFDRAHRRGEGAGSERPRRLQEPSGRPEEDDQRQDGGRHVGRSEARNAPGAQQSMIDRTAWMSEGTFGLMVHWLAPGPQPEFGDHVEDNDRAVDAFDLDRFIDEFVSTGADWLMFTIGQNKGYYASPNSVLDRYGAAGTRLAKRSGPRDRDAGQGSRQALRRLSPERGPGSGRNHQARLRMVRRTPDRSGGVSASVHGVHRRVLKTLRRALRRLVVRRLLRLGAVQQSSLRLSRAGSRRPARAIKTPPWRSTTPRSAAGSISR